ncbi:hypothetical protein TNCV_2690021 [Trichonephila clavipes]|uniref:Uncharacterized protein n=1 Tax=Trichonephila clavipes TaxID=2585209 RepID=A0A8X7BA67_TRICX|nr:hypothetical protein TNCV_2690021 [Trichonephila clavipes]
MKTRCEKGLVNLKPVKAQKSALLRYGEVWRVILKTALKRLGLLWNRLARDENYLNLYREFLRDYERLGHMKEVTNETEPEIT